MLVATSGKRDVTIWSGLCRSVCPVFLFIYYLTSTTNGASHLYADIKITIIFDIVVQQYKTVVQ